MTNVTNMTTNNNKFYFTPALEIRMLSTHAVIKSDWILVMATRNNLGVRMPCSPWKENNRILPV